MREPLHIRNMSLEHQMFASRALVLFCGAALAVLMLAGRMIYLQVLEYDRYHTISEDNRIQVQPLPPTRGLILDRNGELLADNQSVAGLFIVRERTQDLPGLLRDLDELISLAPEEISVFQRRLRRRQRPYDPVPLRGRLSAEEIAKLSVHQHRLPGVTINAQLLRYYPHGPLTAHAIGSVRRINERDLGRLDPVRYAGTDYVGKLGVERFYEQRLMGEVGHQLVEVDARGRVHNELSSTPSRAGEDIRLSLDIRLQRIAQEALGGRRGAVVAIDPGDGGILALVSNPGYDPNLFVAGIDADTYRGLRQDRDTPLFNRAVRGQYAPGSTFKPVVGLAALREGVIDWTRTINDPGWFKLPNSSRLYRDWSWTRRGGGGHGKVDLTKALYRSSNVFFYQVAHEVGVRPIAAMASQFGVGTVTSVDLPDALPGLLPDPDWKRAQRGVMWYPGDTINMGIGQGDLLVTPLQLATITTVIANRGRFLKPHMLLYPPEVVGQNQSALQLPPVRDIPTDHWERLIAAMGDVVHRHDGYDENGTAWMYIGRDMSYRMAGKSGTAQVVEIQQGEEYDAEELAERQRKHAWFIALAPAHAPRIALAVLVENGGSGSEVGAPVAREIADRYLMGVLGLSPIELAPPQPTLAEVGSTRSRSGGQGGSE